jgi:hypothetical protein
VLTFSYSVSACGQGALMMPVMGSLVLVLFYFLFSKVQSFVVLYIVLASHASLSFCLLDPTRRLFQRVSITRFMASALRDSPWLRG